MEKVVNNEFFFFDRTNYDLMQFFKLKIFFSLNGLFGSVIFFFGLMAQKKSILEARMLLLFLR